MKKILGRLAATACIMVVLFSPLLLILDYKRYFSLVMLIWFTSVIYYLWMKRKERWNIQEGKNEKNPSHDPEGQKGISAESNEKSNQVD